MGVRVTQNTKKSTKRTSKQEVVFSPAKFLSFTRLFLTLIGTPFYYLITWVVIGMYSSVWLVGQITIEVIASGFKGANALLSLPYKSTRKIAKAKSKIKKSTIPTYSLPSISIPKPEISFPKIELPKIQLPSYQLNFSVPSINLPRINFPKVPKLAALGAIVITPAVLASIALWVLLLKDLPKPGELATRDQAVTTKIYDRNGELLYKIYRNENRSVVALSDIPSSVKNATIAIEDEDFYSHPGFSIRGITRAFYKNTTQGERTGGSTITQQLIKNTLLTPEKTFIRKVKEVILSVQTELLFSKDEILGMYFNEVGYGGAAYGIEEASQLYFGKHVQDLTLAEASLLAGLPKAPTTYSPFGAQPELAKQRQIDVLQKMAQEGYITQEEATKAGEEQLTFAPQRNDIKAPHFVMYVKQLLADKYGEEVVEEGGLEVHTTLDLKVQEMAQDIVKQETEKIKHMRIGNGAVVITEPKTGAIIAMVGSKDYFDSKTQGNFNVATALRQPGSSIKPVNYSYAIEHKLFSASSVIQDTPITYHVAGSPPYTPHNYDNSYRGNVTLRMALGSSLNIPAVKVLASYGVRNMITHAQQMGITSWTDPSRFGLSLTLGGGEVKMVDMNVAYGTFANYGMRVNVQPITRIVNYKGEELEVNGCIANISTITKLFSPSKAYAAEAAGNSTCASQALDPRTAFIMTDMLKDNSARTPVFGPRSLLVIPNHPQVAVKTGTTQNLRDNWAIGFTQDYVVSAWVGNNNNEPMAYVASGVTGATPIWHKVMNNLLKDKPSVSWEEPVGIIKTAICPRTGTLPCQGCGGKVEYFLPGTEPHKQCVPPKKPEEGENPEVAVQQGQIL